MRITGIDHVGVVVDDLDRMGRLLESLGLAAGAEVRRDDLNARFYPVGDASIELIDVREPSARAARLGGDVARIEHVALRVDDLDRALAALAALGIETAGPPKPSPNGMTAFTRPQTSGGIVLQLLGPPA